MNVDFGSVLNRATYLMQCTNSVSESLVFNPAGPWLCRLRRHLNASLEASKKEDVPAKSITLNDFVVKVIIPLCFYNTSIYITTW